MIATSVTQHNVRQSDVLDLATFAEAGTLIGRVSKVSDDSQHTTQIQGNRELDGNQALVSEAEQVELLLSKASQAIEFLAARCSIMEQELSEKEEIAAENELSATQWQQFAVKLQAQTASDQNTIAALSARAEAAEARIVELEASAAKALETSAVSHAKTVRLQEQVVAAFGRRSPIHSVLQAITLREAAE